MIFGYCLVAWFFIPLDAAGMKIKAEGAFEVKTLSKEEAEHLASEGAKLKLNADGTATEISFVSRRIRPARPFCARRFSE